MNSKGKHIANKFIKEFNVSEITLDKLYEILSNQGYTVVHFNSMYNENDVDNLITLLNLSSFIKERKGFTYADANHRIVFINEDLSEQEKLLVLLHEEGHIYSGHLSEQNVIGRDVIQEFEANEFVHYILNKTVVQKFQLALSKHRKAVTIISICLAIVIVGCVATKCIIKQQSYYGEYYITQTGDKYHEKECIFVKNKDNVERLTKTQFESGDYEPCGTCLP